MAINPMLGGAKQALQQGLQNLDRAAAEIATNGQDPAQPAATIAGLAAQPKPNAGPQSAQSQDSHEAMLDLRLYQRQVEASAKVVATADAMLGHLIDTTA